MARLAQLYDISDLEASKLSVNQINLLSQGAESAVQSLVSTNSAFSQALKLKLLTVRKTVLGR